MMCPGHDRRRRPRRALALLLLCARATEALRPAAPLQAYLGSIATSFDKVRVDEVGDGELGLVLEKGVRAGDVHSVTHIPQSSISTNTYRTLPKTSIGGETREPPFALGA